MVIFKTKQKVKKLEEEITNLKVELKANKGIINALQEKFEEIKLTVDNLVDDGQKTKNANQLMREYFYGEEK